MTKIDWDKPIEAVNGELVRSARLLCKDRKNNDGLSYVCLKGSDFLPNTVEVIHYYSEDGISPTGGFVRNKKETVKIYNLMVRDNCTSKLFVVAYMSEDARENYEYVYTSSDYIKLQFTIIKSWESEVEV